LIKKGAKSAKARGILSEFEYLFPAPTPARAQRNGVLPALTFANEQAVYDVLRKEEEISIDEYRFSGLPSSAGRCLLRLEMKRLIKQSRKMLSEQ